jgi:hypothetical protein
LTFAAASKPGGSQVLIEIKIEGTPGSGPLWGSYPKVFTADTPALEIVQAEVGSIEWSSIRVTTTQPGQTVSCTILVNGQRVDFGPYSKNSVICFGPPI